MNRHDRRAEAAIQGPGLVDADGNQVATKRVNLDEITKNHAILVTILQVLAKASGGKLLISKADIENNVGSGSTLELDFNSDPDNIIVITKIRV